MKIALLFSFPYAAAYAHSEVLHSYRVTTKSHVSEPYHALKLRYSLLFQVLRETALHSLLLH